MQCELRGGLGSVADLVTPTRGSSSSGSGGRNNIISDNRYSVTMTEPAAMARILLSRDSGRGLGGLLAAHRTQHANAIMRPINKIEGKQTDRKTSDLPTFYHLKWVQQILVLDILEG